MPVRHIVIGQKVETGKLLRARELRRDMTAEERRLWPHLRGNRLDGLHFRRQQVIEGFIVDFYCHQVAVIVELDGELHAQQAEYDAERDAILTLRGFRILRVKNTGEERGSPGGSARRAGADRGVLPGGKPDLTPGPFPAREGGANA